MQLIQPSPLLRLVPWFMAGILLDHELAVEWGPWPLLVAVVLTMGMRRWPVAQSVGIGVCMLALGMQVSSRQRAMLTFADTGKEWLTVEAVVVSECAEKSRTMAADLLLAGNGRKVKAYLQKDDRSRALRPGDGLLLRARMEPTDSLRIGTFDYGRYLRVNGFTGRCYVGSSSWQPCHIAWSRLPRMERLRVRALRWRHQLLGRYKVLTADAGEQAYALLAAMTLGDKSALTRELRDVYSMTGASHVLALSGLHMGILFSLLSMLTFFGRGSLLVRALTVCMFWAFALLTGLSTSVVRSALMMSLVAVFSLRGGRVSLMNVLCLAAIVILLVSPNALFDVGFQLSFLSVFAIIMLMPLFDSLWPERFLTAHSWVRMLWSLVAVGVAAQVGTAPLVAYYFGRLPVYFLLTNLVVVPCVYALLWLSLCHLLLPFAFAGQAMLFVVRQMNDALAVIATLPCASIGGLHPTAVQTSMVYVIIASLYLAVVRMLGARIRL